MFIAGGVTYSELRAVSEMMRSTKREIIVGSTHFIKPEGFIKDLGILGDDDSARRYVEEDILGASRAEEFFIDEEEQAMLDKVLIDGKIDPAELAKQDAEEAKKVGEEQNRSPDIQVLMVPWLCGFVPFCGKRFAAWFNGDDVKIDGDQEEEDDGLGGDIQRCAEAIMPCFFSSKGKDTADTQPLQQRGQAV